DNLLRSAGQAPCFAIGAARCCNKIADLRHEITDIGTVVGARVLRGCDGWQAKRGEAENDAAQGKTGHGSSLFCGNGERPERLDPLNIERHLLALRWRGKDAV